MFKCSKCGGQFDDDQRAGGYAQCRECRSAYLKEWRARNPGRNAALCQKWSAENSERKKAFGEAYRADPEHKDLAKAKSAAWYRANRERALQWAKDNYERTYPRQLERHRERFAFDPVYAAKHRMETRYQQVLTRNPHFRQGLALFFATSTWAFYDACPPGYEVDHIHPLKGENFSGLHAPWNLQYLTVSENRRKRNKLETV